MMSSQNAMQQLCPYKGSAYLNQSDKQVAGQAGCRTSRLQDKSVAEQKDIPSRSQAVGTRQEATTSEATAFVFTASLLKEEPEV